MLHDWVLQNHTPDSNKMKIITKIRTLPGSPKGSPPCIFITSGVPSPSISGTN